MPNIMSFEEVSKSVGDSRFNPILKSLLGNVGLTRFNLDLRVSAILSLPFDNPQVSLTRMNLVGSLRSSGYIVSGGRGGGSIYRIESWEPRIEKISTDRWVGLSREMLDWVHTLRTLTEGCQDWVRNWLSFRPELETAHENCFLYPFAYEGARADGFLLSEGSNACLIFRRFKNYPQMRIFHLFGSLQWVLNVAQRIAPASCKPVQIINVSPDQVQELTDLHPTGSWVRREEGVYDLKDIVEHPDKYLNKRGLTSLRARERDTYFAECDLSTEESRAQAKLEAHQITNLWQSFNEKKHRQLAITRDHIAIDADVNKIMFVGIRHQTFPVIHHLFEPLANNSRVVSLMNEKSLNYSQIPGGVYGLSDYNQIMTARHLVDKGFRYEQSGGLDGGGVGLEDKKRKYSRYIFISYTFYTTFPISEYA